jgi:hypothetical protein
VGGGTISVPLPQPSIGYRDVSGYFQLTDLSQIFDLRRIVSELRSMSSIQLIQKLRNESLRWPIGKMSIYEAQDYQSKAATYGFAFVITDFPSASSETG